MKEKRKAQRKQTNEFFGIYHKETDEFIGKLLDLSIMGMKIQAVQDLDDGSMYEFRIDLPMPIAGRHYLAFDPDTPGRVVILHCLSSERPQSV